MNNRKLMQIESNGFGIVVPISFELICILPSLVHFDGCPPLNTCLLN